MIKLKNILAENMRRFKTKNLQVEAPEYKPYLVVEDLQIDVEVSTGGADFMPIDIRSRVGEGRGNRPSISVQCRGGEYNINDDVIKITIGSKPGSEFYGETKTASFFQASSIFIESRAGRATDNITWSNTDQSCEITLPLKNLIPSYLHGIKPKVRSSLGIASEYLGSWEADHQDAQIFFPEIKGNMRYGAFQLAINLDYPSEFKDEILMKKIEKGELTGTKGRRVRDRK